MDFFKDIFENSSSDEDDQNEEKHLESDIEKRLSESKDVEDNLKKDSNLFNSCDKEVIITNNKTEDRNTIAPRTSVNKKAGFGVFANLDLDALNQRKPVEKSSNLDVPGSKDEVIEKTTINSNVDESTDMPSKADDTYGPELPPNYSGKSGFSLFL